MERGMVKWNSGTMELRVERAINDPVLFYSYRWANWACALAIYQPLALLACDS